MGDTAMQIDRKAVTTGLIAFAVTAWVMSEGVRLFCWLLVEVAVFVQP